MKLVDLDRLKWPDIAIFDMNLHGECVPMVRLSDLQTLTPVDAAPVVHGRWNVVLNPFWDAECSECGYAKKNGWEWKFCPNCGAKMDRSAKK